MKISSRAIALAYSVAKKVFNKEITLKDGRLKLVNDADLNENSATDLIYNYRHLQLGNEFKRRLSTAVLTYYFEQFVKENGTESLKRPLAALNAHINYYEKIQKGTMHEARDVYARFWAMYDQPQLIERIDQLLQNIEYFDRMVTEGNEDERKKALQLIELGTCFVAYRTKKEVRFAPSRFLGYQKNAISRFAHIQIDGRDTNVAISTILGGEPTAVDALEEAYIRYCLMLNIRPRAAGNFGAPRRFWELTLERELPADAETGDEFPEGKMVERLHRARERNSKVVALAKKRFLEKHGRLFCEICKFHFESVYGPIGENFIEGHHTLPVSEMPPDYKTTPEEIALLCSNCHRMIHKKRPWLTMDQIQRLLVK
ncbi:MAG TPA: HNH endonuclease [Puia sp.]|nr:HNH endonuclease [Puia sp.]